VIVEEVQRVSKHNNTAKDRLRTCAINLEEKLLKNKETMQVDVAHERKLVRQTEQANQDIKKKKEIEVINIEDSQSQDEKYDNKPLEITETSRMTHTNRRLLMMTKWQLFSGNDLDRDIDISRSLTGGNTFVADQDAAYLIQTYKLTDDWGRFGRMFRSAFVRNNKPPGLYMIPMFWGANGGGHWSTIVIWRQGRRNRGYHIDSIGKSNTTGTIFEKIRCAFTGKRDRFTWVRTECRPQEELECGFRIVEAIRSICIGKKNGDDEELCIQKACRVGVVSGEYCSLSLRRKVADRLTNREMVRNVREVKNMVSRQGSVVSKKTVLTPPLNNDASHT